MADRNKMIRQFAKQSGYARGKPGTRVTEDNPNWNPYTMGDKRGYERGAGARRYSKGRGRPD